MKKIFNNKVSPHIIKRFKRLCARDKKAYNSVMEQILNGWLNGECQVERERENLIQFAVSVDDKIIQAVQEKCSRENYTMSYVVEQLMQHYCDQQNECHPNENLAIPQVEELSSHINETIKLLNKLRDDLESTKK